VKSFFCHAITVGRWIRIQKNTTEPTRKIVRSVRSETISVEICTENMQITRMPLSVNSPFCTIEMFVTLQKKLFKKLSFFSWLCRVRAVLKSGRKSMMTSENRNNMIWLWHFIFALVSLLASETSRPPLRPSRSVFYSLHDICRSYARRYNLKVRALARWLCSGRAAR
jgi:hypothetical protein